MSLGELGEYVLGDCHFRLLDTRMGDLNSRLCTYKVREAA
jgi:hypothetical protein